MAWITPKTDWQETDPVMLDPDYVRIRGNILHLRDMARQLYLPFPLADMADYGPAGFPYVEFFANVDNNVDALLDNTFRPARSERARAYAANGRVWNYDDLNRIESALLGLYTALTAQQNARRTLAFTMGGGIFGACI